MRLFRYQELFRIVIEHDYYKSGNSADFSFEATKDTVTIFRNHGLILKPMSYGFGVFGKVEEDGDDLKMSLPFNANTKLSFVMKLNNPHFMNFTDIPLQQAPHTFYYFNNLTDNSSAGNLFLADKAAITETIDNANQMRMIRGLYKYTHTSTNSSETGTVTFLDNGSTLDCTLNNSEDTFLFQFELNEVKPGRAVFSVDSITEPFYLGKELYTQSIFGIIEIFANSSVPGIYRFVDSSHVVTTKEYRIPFTNRSTTWRYFVYDKMTNTLDDPNISMDGTSFKREYTPTTSYPKEYSVYTFTSGEFSDEEIEKPLPLTEDPVLGITLTGMINGGSSKELIANLPNPDVSLIKPLPSGPERIYSDIVIYV